MKKQTNVTLVTVAVFVATFMTAVEGTIVTTAMPTIVGSLHGIEIMNWVFSIYLLTNAMLTPIYGKMADKIGRKPIFILGTILFIIGSALCGLSNTMLTLIISRAIQGMGAGAMMPVALTIIGDLYDKEKRAKVLGLNSTAWGIASVVGPLAGGVIVDTIGWHWIFFINVPIGIILILLIWLYLVEEKVNQQPKKMDIFGSFSLMGLLLALLLAFQFLGDEGVSTKVLVLTFVAVLAGILFVYAEKRAEDPVISLHLFTQPLFVVVNLVAALASGFLIGIDVYIPMWMQGVLGLSAGIGGLVLAPLSLLWLAGSFLAGRWLAEITVKRVLLRGLMLTLFGALCLVFVPQHTNWLWFFVIATILGIGLGAVTVTCTVSAQSSVPAEQMGVATSFNTLARTIGQTIMVSVFGILLNSITAAQLQNITVANKNDVMNQLVNPQTAKLLAPQLRETLREVLFAGLHGVYLAGAILIIAAFVLTLFLKNSDTM
ncbi:MDR family MFS transporter [Enterococcus dispar]|uniref:Major facilitator superfamily transporter n=1 Tax=Enterococcus dispar ATCC 51266 TaxID=1139219 RepID=S0KP33_9ENTE|nr:MDR family MFS transporter [Enterococcus dispar]EOT40951.1 major facilitator superfamily transporter [Enterococcus dispar ATCC 51266]EOW86676.1 major facilitator superfamily transporter [Enterococcus dispar ATCC 51266]MDT2706403.1 MDR family MFS transporter [Enterococcus dispar]OJG39618.1 major facilitator superfamily transporter [Enterococcus dispar]WCG34296.1 MDR family MFS transporter [Enterococcus dispar]